MFSSKLATRASSVTCLALASLFICLMFSSNWTSLTSVSWSRRTMCSRMSLMSVLSSLWLFCTIAMIMSILSELLLETLLYGRRIGASGVVATGPRFGGVGVVGARCKRGCNGAPGGLCAARCGSNFRRCFCLHLPRLLQKAPVHDGVAHDLRGRDRWGRRRNCDGLTFRRKWRFCVVRTLITSS